MDPAHFLSADILTTRTISQQAVHIYRHENQLGLKGSVPFRKPQGKYASMSRAVRGAARKVFHRHVMNPIHTEMHNPSCFDPVLLKRRQEMHDELNTIVRHVH